MSTATGDPVGGNYNETYGHARYGWREFTVWEGVIALPIMEAAKLIGSDPELIKDHEVQRATRYIELGRRGVEYHHSY